MCGQHSVLLLSCCSSSEGTLSLLSSALFRQPLYLSYNIKPSPVTMQSLAPDDLPIAMIAKLHKLPGQRHIAQVKHVGCCDLFVQVFFISAAM